MKKALLFLLISVSFGCSGSIAWELKTRYYNLQENPANARVEILYLMNGHMRMDNGDLITIFDLIKGEIIYYNKNYRTFWQGTPEKFNAHVKEDLLRMVEQELMAVAEDKREMTRRMYNEMFLSSFPEDPAQTPSPRKFNVRKVSEGEKMLGYITTAYNIYEEGQLLESIWIAHELAIAANFDFVKLSHFLNQLAHGAYASSFEASMEYFDLLKKGYPVRVEMTKADGHTHISEVLVAKKTKFTGAHFQVPRGYAAGTLTQVGVWQGYR